MDQDTLKTLAAELAKEIKSEKDLGPLTQQLIKLSVETALNAEMDQQLGYEKHAPQGRGTGNNRNGYSTKRVTIQAPRDRNSSCCEPQFVRKGPSRLTQIDEQILALYAKSYEWLIKDDEMLCRFENMRSSLPHQAPSLVKITKRPGPCPRSGCAPSSGPTSSKRMTPLLPSCVRQAPVGERR